MNDMTKKKLDRMAGVKTPVRKSKLQGINKYSKSFVGVQETIENIADTEEGKFIDKAMADMGGCNSLNDILRAIDMAFDAYEKDVGWKYASTKKSRKMRKAEEEESEEEEKEESDEEEDDDDDVEVEVEVDKRTRKTGTKKIAPVIAGAIASAAGNVVSNVVSDKLTEADDIALADDIELNERDMIRKPDDIALGCDKCGGKTRKAEMPDADDQQDDIDGKSSNTDELPEDADDQQEENQGEASDEDALPEDADEQQEEKQASRRKNMRKFSVTDRGSERYDGRQNYSQSPMMRECIDRDFPGKEGGEVAKQLNARIAEINKNKRNKSNTSVPMRIRNY